MNREVINLWKQIIKIYNDTRLLGYQHYIMLYDKKFYVNSTPIKIFVDNTIVEIWASRIHVKDTKGERLYKFRVHHESYNLYYLSLILHTLHDFLESYNTQLFIT